MSGMARAIAERRSGGVRSIGVVVAEAARVPSWTSALPEMAASLRPPITSQPPLIN
jgi:hypothetical protein